MASLFASFAPQGFRHQLLFEALAAVVIARFPPQFMAHYFTAGEFDFFGPLCRFSCSKASRPLTFASLTAVLPSFPCSIPLRSSTLGAPAHGGEDRQGLLRHGPAPPYPRGPPVQAGRAAARQPTAGACHAPKPSNHCCDTCEEAETRRQQAAAGPAGTGTAGRGARAGRGDEGSCGPSAARC